ncbi:MAG: S24/S26 family peptidase [Bryobacteraceae bacterium]
MIDQATGGELAAQSLRLNGVMTLRAHGTSMLPSIRPGALLRIERIDGRQAQRGDVVLVRDAGQFRLHRVRRTASDHLVTRGDRHLQDDPPTALEHVLGRVAGAGPDRSCSALARLLRRSDALARIVGRLWEVRRPWEVK